MSAQNGNMILGTLQAAVCTGLAYALSYDMVPKEHISLAQAAAVTTAIFAARQLVPVVYDGVVNLKNRVVSWLNAPHSTMQVLGATATGLALGFGSSYMLPSVVSKVVATALGAGGGLVTLSGMGSVVPRMVRIGGSQGARVVVAPEASPARPLLGVAAGRGAPFSRACFNEAQEIDLQVLGGHVQGNQTVWGCYRALQQAAHNNRAYQGKHIREIENNAGELEIHVMQNAQGGDTLPVNTYVMLQVLENYFLANPGSRVQLRNTSDADLRSLDYPNQGDVQAGGHITWPTMSLGELLVLVKRRLR